VRAYLRATGVSLSGGSHGHALLAKTAGVGVAGQQVLLPIHGRVTVRDGRTGCCLRLDSLTLRSADRLPTVGVLCLEPFLGIGTREITTPHPEKPGGSEAGIR